MKLKSWLENHIYLSKKRTNIRKLVKAEAKTFNASQKDGKNTKREKTFITFPRFYKTQPLVDQTSFTEKEENAWEKSNGQIKARKNVITTEFNASSASTSISSHPNCINYYYTIDDDQSKSSKSWYFATPPSHSYRSETISSDNVIKNKGAYAKKKHSQVSTPITKEDVKAAPHFTAGNKRCGNFGNFMLPNFSYDSTAICRESNYTGEDGSYEIPYEPQTSLRRRMMIRTNPWFDYSRIDTSGYSVSDESFTSNNTHTDNNHLGSDYLGAEKRNEKSLNYDEGGSLLWTSTLKNQLGNPVACNGDSGFYDDIRDIRGSEFTSIFSNVIPKQASNDYLDEMTSIIDNSYGDREATINFADEGNYYFSINEEDSGCSNTNSWSYRSSEPSSNCGELNNDTWERSTSVSCERPLKSEKELCSQVLSRSESYKMSPTSAKNKLINNIMYWDRNHKELLNKLKDYRNKINENKRYLNGKVYADCRRQFHRYQVQSDEAVDTSNVMIYEMDPIIYI